MADLVPLQLGARPNGYMPYYVRITVTNESGGDSSMSRCGGSRTLCRGRLCGRNLWPGTAIFGPLVLVK